MDGFFRAARRIGVAGTILWLVLVSFPPRPLAPFLPGFFFVVGVAYAYVGLALAILRLGVPAPVSHGEEFIAVAFVLAGLGATKALVIPLLVGALAIQVFRLREATRTGRAAGRAGADPRCGAGR